MLWPSLPKRLQSALKGLCCLARSGNAMRSQEIAKRINVSKTETAKVLQLLAWGGFVTSRRGTKGGFQLVASADQLTMGEVINFFLSQYQAAPDGDCPVMRVFRETSAPCQEAFGRLRLVEIAKLEGSGKVRTNAPEGSTEAPSRKKSVRFTKVMKFTTIRSLPLTVAIVIVMFFVAFVPAQAQNTTNDGAALYKTKCAMCHGPDGAGKTPVGQKLNIRDLRSPEVQKQSDSDLSHLIGQGKGKMPAFGKTLSEDQIKLLVAQIRQLGKK